MFQKPKGMDQIMQAALVSMMAGNTQEHTEVNTHTQARVPFVQAVLLALSVVAWLGGVWLLGGGLGALASGRWDLVVASGLLWLVAGMWIAFGSALVNRSTIRKAIAARVLVLFVAFLGTMATLELVRLMTTGFGGWLRFLAGLALVAASSLLIWRFANELVNPLYPRPPTVDLLREMLQPQANPVVVHEPTPYHYNGTKAGDVTPEAGEEEEEPHFVSDHELLMAFVERAAVIGLARTRWLKPSAPEFLVGKEVTRGTYNKMIALAGRWKIVRPGGGGKPAEWNVDDPAEALKTLRLAWESVNG